MLLSQSCQIALKSIAHISGTETGRVTVKELSKVTGENAHTIAKVLQNVVKSGLLSSVTGPTGGFYLTEEQLKGTLSEIIKSIDGADIFEKCLLGLSECSAKRPCPVHNKYAPLRKEFSKIFDEVPLTQLSSVIESGAVFLK